MASRNVTPTKKGTSGKKENPSKSMADKPKKPKQIYGYKPGGELSPTKVN